MRGLDLPQALTDGHRREASGLDRDGGAGHEVLTRGGIGSDGPARAGASARFDTPKIGADSGFNPHVVTRGVGGPFSKEHDGTVEAHIDWYAVTIDDRPDRVLALLQVGLCATVSRSKARNGYLEAFELVDASRTVATVYAGGPNGAPHAVATGLASEKFAAVVRRNWPNAQRVSRVDSRIDFGGAESDSHTWDVLYATVVAFARERGLTTSVHGDFLGSGEAGRTLYVGSPKSEVHLRLYEKSKEVRAHSRNRSGCVVSDWVRVEVEVRPKKRTARQSAGSASALDVWGYSGWTKDLLALLTGLDVPRTQITQWGQSRDERAVENLARQYGPAMRRIAESEGWDSLLARIESAVFAEEPPTTANGHRHADGPVPPQAARLAS